MPGWSANWQVLFDCAAASLSNGPKLGVNYVQASAPTTTLELRGSSALVVGQDLAKHGIAGVVWNCARAMVSFFVAESQFVAQRYVLELGAGPGGMGLALASACKVSSLLLTDLESVVPLTRENVRAAAEQHDSIATLIASNRLDVRALSWGEPLDSAIAVEVVIASDCLYESASHSALLSTLLDLTDISHHSQQVHACRHRTIVLLAYKQRLPAKEKIFFESAAEHFDIAVYSTESSTSNTSNNDGEPIEYFDEAIYICKLERRPHDKHEAGTSACTSQMRSKTSKQNHIQN